VAAISRTGRALPEKHLSEKTNPFIVRF